MKVGIVQEHFTADLADNKKRIDARIKELADKGAELVVLSELHRSLYFCQTEDVDMFDLAETIPGESTEYYQQLSKDLNIVLVLSLFEKRAAGLYHNTAVVMDKGRFAGKYRKMHIPDDPAYYEKFYFTPGDLGFHPIQTSVGKLGLMVCWDQWYPEGARLMALEGADMLIYPTAIGYESTDTRDEQERQRGAWMTVQRGHAVANGLPVVTVNRVGYEPDPSGVTGGIQFWGSSFVAGPQGELLYEGSTTDAEAVIVDVDMQRCENVRRIWPFLRDRRIEEFGDLTKRFRD
ncbi:MAG: carbon-nitrogen hydrolase [Paludibacteraceae bacterium]|nr:carbon-nitrogen hydrolase [Paludibacteraceae bacterium]